jgi:hypothetical protein
VRRLMVMMGSGVMMGRRLVVMFTRGMFRVTFTRLEPPSVKPTRIPLALVR